MFRYSHLCDVLCRRGGRSARAAADFIVHASVGRACGCRDRCRNRASVAASLLLLLLLLLPYLWLAAHGRGVGAQPLRDTHRIPGV